MAGKNNSEKTKLPEQTQLERELSKYIAEKYGDQAKIVSPNVCPALDMDIDDQGSGVWSRINFDMRPDELVAYLDQYIVRQEEAKAVLATKVCTHFNRARYLCKIGVSDPAEGVGLIKNNVLMIGPTGVGKTYMVKLIAAKLGVPFVKGDATKFSETGYVGGDVEDLIRDLVQEADDDLELAQFGIVYIDEIDKIAGTPNLIGPDVSRTGVQRALLKPMEETEVDLKTPHDPISQIQAIEKFRRTGEREKKSLNTRHILFIMSGAFNQLAETIKKRLNTRSMGFGGNIAESKEVQDYLKQVVPQDLVDFGFETEFVGRLPITVILEELEAEDLYTILKNPNNPVAISKRRDFAAYEIDLRFEDQALKKLAEQASQMKTGARALVSVLEKALLPFEKRLPSTAIKRLLVTPELVEDPQGALEKLQAHPHDSEQEHRFAKAIRDERVSLLHMIARRESLYAGRLERPLTPARMDLIADEYYRSGMSLGTAFERVLEQLNEVHEFEENFYERFNLEINFGPGAEVAIVSLASEQGLPVTAYLNRLTQMLEPGLRLVRDRIGQADFHLPEAAVIDTEGYLADLFQKHYQTTLVDGDKTEHESN